MEPTQESQSAATQARIDPRRLGIVGTSRENEDISDIICILHPCSAAAIRIVANVAAKNKQHVLQNSIVSDSGEPTQLSEANTLVLQEDLPDQALDLALRFSSHVCDPTLGFAFGRNKLKCDIDLDPAGDNRRLSGLHFHIYLNDHGFLMLKDTSTNGTVVEGALVGSKRHQDKPSTRMLETGLVIELLNPEPKDVIKFIIRIPAHNDEAYRKKFEEYLTHVIQARVKAETAKNGGQLMSDAAIRGVMAARLAGPVNSKTLPPRVLPRTPNFGMRWDGGGKYNCVGILGKGAFATVYQLATVYEGTVFAAKELEKRRFIKNGILDPKINMEMVIMQQISHPNIVKLHEHKETKSHLYLIMELVSGGDLNGYLQSHAKLAEDLALCMSKQMLSALEYLHSQNITHRDIKPDNILIASEDPFVCKLGDFGLSKMVHNNETFMKTFCGTILYCAPEVYNAYDTYTTQQGTKRQRNDGSGPRRSYGQAVDVWSYAAVLWTALCGKPPFKPGPDGNTHVMLDKIMKEELDVQPLKDCGVSDDAIDLMKIMLDTDPQSRPSETECLAHPWLNGGVWAEEPSGEVAEMESQADKDYRHLDASQISLDPDAPANAVDDSPDADEHAQKRMRADSARRAVRRTSQMPADMKASGARWKLPADLPLFGEIHPALHGTGAAMNPGLPSGGAPGPEYQQPDSHSPVDSADGDSRILQLEHELTGPIPGLDEEQEMQEEDPRTSLTGAESMVAELNMRTPGHGPSHQSMPQEGLAVDSPQTPVAGDTKPNTKAARQSSKAASSAGASKDSTDITPKVKPRRDRQIKLPIHASAYYDPFDETTQNVQYASRVSGHDFAAQPAATEDSVKLLPAEVQASFLANRKSFAEQQSLPGLQQPQQSMETGSAPLARLVSTSDSFASLTIPLTQRTTTWGRATSCHQIYEHPSDTRVPKCALELVFHAQGIGEVEKNGGNWVAMNPKLLILTQASNGVWVNNMRMAKTGANGNRNFGFLAHGDRVDVYRPRGSVASEPSSSSGHSGSVPPHEPEQWLTFVVEFCKPEVFWERPAGEVFQVLTDQ